MDTTTIGRFGILLILFAFAQAAPRGLYFGGCTASPNKILLCINQCQSDDITDWVDPSKWIFNQHSVVLDTETQTLNKVRDIDKAIVCPNFDENVIKQPYNKLIAECKGNQTILWRFEFTNSTLRHNALLTELPTQVDDRFFAFYFVSYKPKLRIYLFIQGNNKVRKGYIVDQDGIIVNNNWEFDLQESQEILERYVLLEAFLSKDRCNIIGKKEPKKYPVIFDGVGLAAFPEFQNTLWYLFNDTGFYPIAGTGTLDKRRSEIIEVKTSSILFHSSNSSGVFYEINLGPELEKFKVRRPPIVQPSVIIFTVSTLIIVGLMVAEVVTQRKKSGIPCCPKEDQGHHISEGEPIEDDEIELSEIQKNDWEATDQPR